LLLQVPHTYALYEAGYGIMNEHQLGIGESTCASWLYAAPTSAGGKAQIEVRELSKLALERTKTAREAVLLMGSLAEELGFYSADWGGGDMSRGEGGESLQVVDPHEAWVFHVSAGRCVLSPLLLCLATPPLLSSSSPLSFFSSLLLPLPSPASLCFTSLSLLASLWSRRMLIAALAMHLSCFLK
jgi:hypothetical protein